MRVLYKKDLPSFIEELKKSYKVVAPVKKDTEYVFDDIKDAESVILEYPTTILSTKEFFFPQREIILEYDLGETIQLKSSPEAEEICLIGIHPCDIHALLRFDEAYLTFKPDPFYEARRKNSLIIGIYCNRPNEFCFCTSMGTDTVKEGYDLMLIDAGEKYGIEIGSKKGEELLKSINLFKEEDEIKKPELKGFVREVNTENLPEIMRKEFNNKIWKYFGDRCLGCGKCVFVCPTCYCFNVIEDTDIEFKSGKRERFWDGCVLTDFAAVAGGGNFRADRTARLKQRILHKFSYYPERYEEFGCTGCGRCINVCPSDIDCTRIINLIRG